MLLFFPSLWVLLFFVLKFWPFLLTVVVGGGVFLGTWAFCRQIHPCTHRISNLNSSLSFLKETSAFVAPSVCLSFWKIWTVPSVFSSLKFSVFFFFSRTHFFCAFWCSVLHWALILCCAPEIQKVQVFLFIVFGKTPHNTLSL